MEITDGGGVKHFKNLAAGLLSDVLAENLSLNDDDFRRLLDLGALYVNDERQTKNRMIQAESSFRVHTSPRRYNCDFPWRELIVFENDFCLVLNKPSGVPSHPLADNVIENSLTQVSLARNYPLFVTHRLDRLTSGLIVYAKKPAFAKEFNLQMQKRSIKKKYVALVEGSKVFADRLTDYMDPAAGTPKKLSDVRVDGWQVCELEILEQRPVAHALTWVKVNLLTGRTHQIRAQFSQRKAPIAGDLLYGSKVGFQKDAIALRSCEIEFSCNGERLKFSLSEDLSTGLS